MILLKKSDRYAIHLEFDINGAKAIVALLDDAKSSEPCEYDRAIFTGKRPSELIEKKLKIEVSERFEDSIHEYDENVVLRFHPDTCDYAIDNFRKAIVENEFFPAELCELETPKGKDGVQLYCILIK